mmetsp:Transcript_14783/g.39225  ORF Transcript_14783/g.39225 Transcript_14783/m.39225 type:complete len:260 (+) Transcript_14783:1462-2241(+)
MVELGSEPTAVCGRMKIETKAPESCRKREATNLPSAGTNFGSVMRSPCTFWRMNSRSLGVRLSTSQSVSYVVTGSNSQGWSTRITEYGIFSATNCSCGPETISSPCCVGRGGYSCCCGPDVTAGGVTAGGGSSISDSSDSDSSGAMWLSRCGGRVTIALSGPCTELRGLLPPSLLGSSPWLGWVSDEWPTGSWGRCGWPGDAWLGWRDWRGDREGLRDGARRWDSTVRGSAARAPGSEGARLMSIVASSSSTSSLESCS